MKWCPCQTARYCSRECQGEHWGVHRDACAWRRAGVHVKHGDAWQYVRVTVNRTLPMRTAFAAGLRCSPSDVSRIDVVAKEQPGIRQPFKYHLHDLPDTCEDAERLFRGMYEVNWKHVLLRRHSASQSNPPKPPEEP